MAFLDLSQLNKPQCFDAGNGIQIHTLNGVLHREDGPARMFHNHEIGGERICEWWMQGKFLVSDQLTHEIFHSHLHKPGDSNGS